MDKIQQLLLISEKLYATLEKIAEDKDDLREKQIELVNKLLDARGQTIDALTAISDKPLVGHKDEVLLKALNQGIINRLEEFKNEISSDIRQLKVSAKSEQRYVNPYSHLRNLDGRYIDKRE